MTGDILARLQGAQNDEEREWLVLQFSLDGLEPAVQAMVWAAAVPHWFDEPFLAAILDVTELSAFQKLTTLSFVETFPGRGWNVHERSRKLLLARLWQQQRERLQLLSARAAAYCERQDGKDVGWQVETIYHLLMADEPGAEDVFRDQGVEWHNRFEYEKVEVLVRPVLEAVEAGWLGGEAAGWAYYRQGRLDITYNRYLPARVNLQTALDFKSQDRTLTANCIKALGDVHVQLSEYGAARTRYEEALPIYRDIGDRLGEANCIQALGYVYRGLEDYEQARVQFEAVIDLYRAFGSRLGEVNGLFGLADLDRVEAKWAEATEKYQQALAFYQQSGMAFNIALVYQRLGYAAKGAGDVVAARQHFEAALAVAQRVGLPLAESIQADLDNLP